MLQMHDRKYSCGSSNSEICEICNNNHLKRQINPIFLLCIFCSTSVSECYSNRNRNQFTLSNRPSNNHICNNNVLTFIYFSSLIQICLTFGFLIRSRFIEILFPFNFILSDTHEKSQSTICLYIQFCGNDFRNYQP